VVLFAASGVTAAAPALNMEPAKLPRASRHHAACPLSVASVTGTNLVFATRVQAGTRIRDDIEFTTQLPATNWSALASFEFNAEPDQTSFETGWQPVEWTVDLSASPSPTTFSD